MTPRRDGWVSQAIAEGRWLTKKRALQIAILFAAVNVITAASIMQSYGAKGADNGANALPDFAAFWAAAVATLNGTPALAYDPVAHRAIQAAAIGREYQFWLSWHYPPTFQLMVAPFGALPLFLSFAVWNLLTLGFYLLVCWRILPNWITLIAACGVTTSLFVFAIGQTGFFTAGLLGLFLLLLDRRPVLAGACLALLTIKPHLGLAAPFALVAGGKWRVIVATAVGAALMLAAAHLAFGAGIWTAFRDSIRLSSNIFAADADFWALYTTLYGAARMIGAPFWLAALFHACIAAVVLWLLVRIWRSPRVAPDMKAAVFCYALAIVTPRMLHYDMHILFIGALFQVRHALAHGFARWEKSALLLAAAVIFLFVFHARLPLLRLHALAAPILMFGCMAGRPELRRFFGLRREGAVEFN